MSHHPDVAESWASIREWLGQHAPAVLAMLNPPADDADLDRAERATGVALPADLLAWWRLANGTDGRSNLLPPWYSPYPITQALESRRIWLEVWHDEETRVFPDLPGVREYIDGLLKTPAGTPCQDMWLPVWLPVAGSGGGQDLFVDLRPGPLHGCVMEFDRVGAAGAAPLWPNVRAMLAAVADAFEQGSTVVGRFPVALEADDGRINWH
ncbi:SMI1/KNR4 family protein [Amycolatopsis nigrescens]|uniref:SMI1/KNR4 family protein n=1 Tax=Amycolatopsis nigrescens TaxID=381445 RepID=UPI0003728503|nr:SMI1/KNR4 family protein [Amycolatopsis nigrescens]